MTQAHTPGPWIEYGLGRFSEKQYGVRSMAVDGPDSDITDCITGPNAKANARLIAAAPDLLEALEEAADELWEFGLKLREAGALQDCAEVQKKEVYARAAIARARGAAQ